MFIFSLSILVSLSKLNFEINLETEKSVLENIYTDYEYYSKYLEQIESVEIIKNENDEIITKEVLVFSTYLKNKITQTSIHKKIDENIFFTEILDGHAKGTTVEIKFFTIDSGTKVVVDAELKLSLKAKIFYPIIKKAYKHFFQGVFYKMQTRAAEVKIGN